MGLHVPLSAGAASGAPEGGSWCCEDPSLVPRLPAALHAQELWAGLHPSPKGGGPVVARSWVLRSAVLMPPEQPGV